VQRDSGKERELAGGDRRKPAETGDAAVNTACEKLQTGRHHLAWRALWHIIGKASGIIWRIAPHGIIGVALGIGASVNKHPRLLAYRRRSLHRRHAARKHQ